MPDNTCIYMYMFSRLGIKVSLAIYMYMYFCLCGLWLGGLLHLSFLSDFLKLVYYAHVFPCMFVN